MAKAGIGVAVIVIIHAIALSAKAQTSSTADMIQRSIEACLESSQNITVSTAENAKSNCVKVIEILDRVGQSATILDPIVLLSEGVAHATVVSAELMQSGEPINSSQCNLLQNAHFAFYQLSQAADPNSLGAALSDNAEINRAREMYEFSAPQRSQLTSQQPTCRMLTSNPLWPSN